MNIDQFQLGGWLLELKDIYRQKEFLDQKCTFGYLTKSYKPIIDKTLDYLQKHNSTFIGNTPITQLKIKK